MRSSVYAQRVKILIYAGMLSTVSLYAGFAASDDTEIYFANPLSEAQSVANVMFMFDTSGSMSEWDDAGSQRITRLKEAMIDVVDSAKNVNIGIGSFNGRNTGGSIRVPSINVDSDLCPGATCTDIRLRVPIKQAADDAEQNASGFVSLHNNNLDLTSDVADSQKIEAVFTTKMDSDDAVESVYGFSTTVDSPSLPAFYDPNTSDTVMIGVRFEGVVIPTGANLLEASILFDNIAEDSLGSQVDAQIFLESNDTVQGYSDSFTQRIYARDYYWDVVNWDSLPDADDEAIAETPSLVSLLNTMIDSGDWGGSGDLGFKLQFNDEQPDENDRRAFSAHESGNGPKLKIVYTTSQLQPEYLGLRFDDLNIPRGATINHAKVEFTVIDASSTPTQMTIKGESVDDSVPFTVVNNGLSSRISASGGYPTTASVNWDIGEWVKRGYEENTPDVASIIQEIVDRPGWCGGNALSLYMFGQGNRVVESRDRGIYEAPTLQISYDPSDIDFTDTCLRSVAKTAVVNGIDDLVATAPSGVIEAREGILRSHSDDGSAQTIALRFSELDVPQGASITDAYIALSSAGYEAGNVAMNIAVENTGFAETFDSAVANTVSTRLTGASSVLWGNVPETNDGNTLRTPDISTLVEAVVGRSDWAANSAIAFGLTPTASSTASRLFASADKVPGTPARLVVHYQQDSTALGNAPTTLITGRDEIVRAMLDLGAEGGTPLVDAYYEAALYMTGNPVEFGLQRWDTWSDDARFHRTSADKSFKDSTGRYIPPGCSQTDLDNVACVDETINGSPTYIKPEFGECKANQIVLLSDGRTNASDSVSRIQNLTGMGSCENRSVEEEKCGVELATWLNTTDHDSETEGVQGIVTHTVGFNVTSQLLEDIATAGNGGTYRADSSSELTNAFNSIIQQAITLDSTFVAPSASISLTNRLVNNNELYFALFKPGTTAKWGGNLKKYQLGKNSTTNVVEVLDSMAATALDTTNGGFKEDSKSLWSTEVDGKAVEKGGAASKQSLTRKLYASIQDGSGDIELQTFHETTTDITKDLLGIPSADDAYRTELLQWARGVDLKDSNNNGEVDDVRTQMGDPLHSTQAIIHYATSDTTSKSLIYIGTNEGFLHAINTATGVEEFAYIPEELLGNLNTYYQDEPLAHDQRPHGLDGEVSAWHNDTNGNGLVDNSEKAYVYIGMRRGGKNYYALDVSNPDSPKLQWVIKGGVGDFSNLAQTWSRPVKARINFLDTEKDVLIFGAGYDDSNDNKSIRTDDQAGRGFFIVDATTGALIIKKRAIDFTGMDYSMPSDIRVINIDNDGFADMLFVGDMGGQVWRFDIDNSATVANKFISGSVAANFAGTDADNHRRFFSEPDVSLLRDPAGSVFLNVAIGSGARPSPNSTTTTDRFYSFRDAHVFSPPFDDDGAIDYPTALTESTLFNASATAGSSTTSANLENGWYIQLPTSGEKVLSGAVTLDSNIVFTTYVPTSTQSNICTPSVGNGRVYTVSAFTGDAVNTSAPDAPLDLLGDRYVELKTRGIPPRVSGLIVDAAPNTVSLFAGLEALGNTGDGTPFERIFWAEQ